MLALLCLSAVLLIDFAYFPRQGPVQLINSGQKTISLAGQVVKVSVADTPQAREKGLSGRIKLASDEGMLFIFSSDAKYSFWMKDMRFPIDILWISSDEKILDMRQNVSPETYPAVFTPSSPARYVLELSAGYSEAHGVKIGDTIRL